MLASIGDYHNNVSYPSQIEYDTFYVYDGGTVIEDGLIIWDFDVRDTKRNEWQALGYTVTQKVDWEAYDAAKAAYDAEELRLQQKFKDDITAHFGLTGHPKADLLFDKAWTRGHSNGYTEVFYIYDDLHVLLE